MMRELLENILLQDEDIKKSLRTAAATAAIGAGALGLGIKHGETPKLSYKATEPTKISQHTQTSSVLGQDSGKAINRATEIDIPRIIRIESGGDPNAVGSKGERGLMQIRQTTWIDTVKKMGKDWSWDEAFDPDKNVAVGTYYMNVEIPRLLQHYGIPDSTNARIAAYNMGAKALSRVHKLNRDGWLPIIPRSTQDYIGKYNSVGESTIDFPQEDLDLAIWEKKGNTYTLRPEVKGLIFSALDRYEPVDLRDIADNIHITGSIGTNQYTDDADIDVHIVTRPSKVKDGGIVQKEVFKWYKENRDRLGAYVNKHPIEVYLQFNSKQELMSEAVYDIIEDKWLVGPKIVHMGYDPYKDFSDILDDVADAAEDADELLGELRRDIVDYDIIKDAMSRMTGLEKQRLFNNLLTKLQEIEDDIEELVRVKGEWIKMRREASLPASEEEALENVELAKKFRDANAIFKFLNRYKYMRVIGELERLIQDEEITPEELDVIRRVAGVS